MSKYSFLFLLSSFLFFSCSENPVGISQFSPDSPQASLINKSLLISGASFSVGYLNGNIRSNRVSISWTQSTDADFLCYKLYRDNNLIFTTDKITTINYTDSLLAQNHYYKYMIAILNNSGSHKADTISVKTPLFQTPALQFQVLPDTTLKIFWNKTAESATSFKLEKRGPLDPGFTLLAQPTDTFYIDNKVINLTTYSYRLQAINSYESTTLGSSTSFFVQYRMNAPTALSLQQVPGVRMVRLLWNDNSTAENGFNIFRRRGTTGNFSIAGTAPTNSVSFIDQDSTNLLADSTYYYYVQAFNQKDTTAHSNTVSITIINAPANSLTENFNSPIFPDNWLLSGNSQWFITNSNYFSSPYSARSGTIQNSQYTDASKTITFNGSKTISFNFKVSSEASCDYLSFYINGSYIQGWSGETGWQNFSINYTGYGSVTLEWIYSKDSSISSGSDAAWIDDVVVK
jgi:hypothetical protein